MVADPSQGSIRVQNTEGSPEPRTKAETEETQLKDHDEPDAQEKTKESSNQDTIEVDKQNQDAEQNSSGQIEEKPEPAEDISEDTYNEDETDFMREMLLEEIEEERQLNESIVQELGPEIEDKAEAEPFIDIAAPKANIPEPMHVLEPRLDTAPQTEAQDLTSLEAELFTEPVDQTEAEEQVETKGQ